MKSMNVNHNDTFNTPDYLFNQLNEVFQFDLDVACDSTNCKTANGFKFDKGENGLEKDWNGRVFCNPPFSEKDKWIKKACYEVYQKSCPIVVMVLPLNCMSTKTFYDYIIKNNIAYEILKGRVQFLDNDTKQERKLLPRRC